MVHLHDFLHRHLARQDGGQIRDDISHMLHNAQGTVNRAMNIKQDIEQDVSTIVSVVFVTMPAAFTGPTAGFVTQTGNNRPTLTATTTARDTQATQATQTRALTSAATPTANTAFRSTTQQSLAVGTPVHTSRVADTSSAASPSDSAAAAAASEGMSGGAKAGIAFAVIAIVGVLVGIALLLIKRKKKQRQGQESHELDREKSGFSYGSHPPHVRAPRLSLRPVTQFLPSVGEPKVSEMTSATGGLGGFLYSGQPTPHNRQGSRSNDAANPFGRNAERLDAAAAADRAAENAPIPVIVAAPPPAPVPNPFADKQQYDHRSISPEVSPPDSMSTSPTKSDIGLAAAAAAATAAAPSSPTNQPNNVHRVQLAFEPSMEDELELRAGQVIRLLHEYDDGWALCAYMDRSRQGVAPRTCLSKMPIKPRPAGPPPGMRPTGPPPHQQGIRNFSGPPTNGPRNMYPAPLSPSLPNINGSAPPPPLHGVRQRAYSVSQSGEGYSNQAQPAAWSNTSPIRNHRRSASAGQLAPESPTRNGVPSRKPVPGQAM